MQLMISGHAPSLMIRLRQLSLSRALVPHGRAFNRSSIEIESRMI
jgi:hypothetical protein